MSIDPEQFRIWKDGMDAANKIQLAEQRNATYADRFRSLTAIWRQASFMGQTKPSAIDFSVNDTWQRLRQAYFEVHEREVVLDAMFDEVPL